MELTSQKLNEIESLMAAEIRDTGHPYPNGWILALIESHFGKIAGLILVIDDNEFHRIITAMAIGMRIGQHLEQLEQLEKFGWRD